MNGLQSDHANGQQVSQSSSSAPSYSMMDWFRQSHGQMLALRSGMAISTQTIDLESVSSRFLIVHRNYMRLEGQSLILAIIGGIQLSQAKLAHCLERPGEKWSTWMGAFCDANSISMRTCQRWRQIAERLPELLDAIAEQQQLNPPRVADSDTALKLLLGCTMNQAMRLLAEKKPHAHKKAHSTQRLSAPGLSPVSTTIERARAVFLYPATSDESSRGEASIGVAIPSDVSLESDDGWRGRLCLIFPSEALGAWSNRLLQHIAEGNVTDAITVVPARTREPWFGDLSATATLVGFLRATPSGLQDTVEQQPGNSGDECSLAIFLHGNTVPVTLFAQAFGDVCELLQPYRVTS